MCLFLPSSLAISLAVNRCLFIVKPLWLCLIFINQDFCNRFLATKSSEFVWEFDEKMSAALKRYFQELRREVKDFHTGIEYEIGVVFNQRLFFNGDLNGNRIPRNELISVDITELSAVIEDYFELNMELISEYVEYSLRCAYSMNKRTFQSATDKDFKKRWVKKYIRTTYRNRELSVSEKQERVDGAEKVLDLLDEMEFNSSPYLNPRNALSWQLKNAIYYLNKIFKTLKLGNVPQDRVEDIIDKGLLGHDKISSMAVIICAILNYMGCHVAYSRIKNFREKELLRYTPVGEAEVNALYGRLDWKRILRESK